MHPAVMVRDSGLLGPFVWPLADSCSTAAIPAFVAVTVTGAVEPSVTGTSAQDDETTNRCATAFGRMRWLSPTFSTI